MTRGIPRKIPTKKQVIHLNQAKVYDERIRKERQEAEAAAAAENTPSTMADGSSVQSNTMTDAEAQKPKPTTGLRPLKSATKFQKTKFSSSTKKTGLNRANYDKRRQEREEYKEMKRKEADLKELFREEKDEERKKAEQRKLQREENEKRGMVVQKITNTKKLKGLSRKQMQQIMRM